MAKSALQDALETLKKNAQLAVSQPAQFARGFGMGLQDLGNTTGGQYAKSAAQFIQSAPAILARNINEVRTNPQSAQQIPGMINQGIQQMTTQAYGNNPVSKFLGSTVGGITQGFTAGLTAPYTNKNPLEKAGDVLGGIGSVYKPASAIGFGAFNAALNTGGNILSKRPLTQNLGQSYSQGIDTGAKLAGLEPFIGKLLSPVLKRIAPTAMSNINQYFNLAKTATSTAMKQKFINLMVTRIKQQLGAKGLSGLVTGISLGATSEAKTDEERLKNAISTGLQFGTFNVATAGLGMGGSLLKGQVINPAIQNLKDNPNQPGFARIPGGGVPKELQPLADRFITKGFPELAKKQEQLLPSLYQRAQNSPDFLTFMDGVNRNEVKVFGQSTLKDFYNQSKGLPKELQPLAEEAKKYVKAWQLTDAISQGKIKGLEKIKSLKEYGFKDIQDFHDYVWKKGPYNQSKGLPQTPNQGLKAGEGVNNPQATGTTPKVETGTLPEQVVKATTETPQPKPIMPKQPVSGDVPPNVPTNPSLAGSVPPEVDPVQKIITALTGAKPIRGQQEAIYSKIRSQQAGALSGIGQQMKGESGYYQKLGQLKGEMPKVSFESIKSQFTQNELDSLYNKIEQSNITPFEKITAQGGLKKLLGAEGGAIPNNSEISLLNEIFPKEFTQAILAKRPLVQRLFANATDALNIPRAIMATADMSAPLRQGAFLIGRPKQWLPAFGSMVKYFFSPKVYEGLQADIQARPTYQLMREGKLAITNQGSLLNQHEETFMSNFVDKIPGIGAVTQASERAYSGFLNKLRADTFDSLVKSAKDQGLDVNKIAPDIASFVNNATGRGELPGALNRASVALNGLLFSPRLLASRLNLMNPTYYTGLDPFVRKEALKSLLTFGGTAMTVLGLAKLGGASVGADPRSADFGKIKLGDTRYDILAGFQQPIRLASQLISGHIISTTTGKDITLGEGYKPMTRAGIVANFLQSKESPAVGFALGLLQGTNSIGQPFNVAPELIQRFIPMVIQDMYDLAKDKNSPAAALMGIPGMFGVGVQTYGKQVLDIKTNKPTSLPGLAEDIASKITGPQTKPLAPGMEGAILEGQKARGEAASKSKTDPVKLWGTVKKLIQSDPNKASQYIGQLKQKNPSLYTQIMKERKDEMLKVTPEEKIIRGLGISDGSRARAVKKYLTSLPADQRQAKISEWARKGIITKDVYKQMVGK